MMKKKPLEVKKALILFLERSPEPDLWVTSPEPCGFRSQKGQQGLSHRLKTKKSEQRAETILVYMFSLPSSIVFH